MYGNNREEIRGFILSCWNKREHSPLTLSALEQHVIRALQLHPEFHPLLDSGEDALQRDFAAAADAGNPFLHIGLHITLYEQLDCDRPAGIRDIYLKMLQSSADRHHAEHRLISCLEQSLWEAQARNSMPDEQRYLECLRKSAGQ
jgi:hypothetical protein